MKRVLLVFFIFIFGLGIGFGQDEDIQAARRRNRVFTHGPRVGGTYMMDMDNPGFNTIYYYDDYDGFEIYPLMSQFGYHFNFRIPTGTTVQPLLQLIPLVGGVEQQLFLPSISGIIGFSLNEQLDFGFGPNLSLSGTGIVFAMGYNIIKGDIYYPIDFAVAYSGDTLRFSLLTGFNFP